jgi:hypothetical protein
MRTVLHKYKKSYYTDFEKMADKVQNWVIFDKNGRRFEKNENLKKQKKTTFLITP